MVQILAWGQEPVRSPVRSPAQQHLHHPSPPPTAWDRQHYGNLVRQRAAACRQVAADCSEWLRHMLVLAKAQQLHSSMVVQGRRLLVLAVAQVRWRLVCLAVLLVQWHQDRWAWAAPSLHQSHQSQRPMTQARVLRVGGENSPLALQAAVPCEPPLPPRSNSCYRRGSRRQRRSRTSEISPRCSESARARQHAHVPAGGTPPPWAPTASRFHLENRGSGYAGTQTRR